MTQYKTLNVKLSNAQLNKLKSGIKNYIGETLNLSTNVVGDSNDETISHIYDYYYYCYCYYYYYYF